MCIALWVNYEETFTIALAFLMSPSSLNERQFPGQGASVQFKVPRRSNILRNICKFAGFARI